MTKNTKIITMLVMIVRVRVRVRVGSGLGCVLQIRAVRGRLRSDLALRLG